MVESSFFVRRIFAPKISHKFCYTANKITWFVLRHTNAFEVMEKHMIKQKNLGLMKNCVLKNFVQLKGSRPLKYVSVLGVCAICMSKEINS